MIHLCNCPTTNCAASPQAVIMELMDFMEHTDFMELAELTELTKLMEKFLPPNQLPFLN